MSGCPKAAGHIAGIQTVTPSALGCEECLKSGSEWLHLRICRTCGHVGCCDNSPNKHATAHFHATGHPVIEGYDPPEGWGWCYVDEVLFDLSTRKTPQTGRYRATTDSSSTKNKESHMQCVPRTLRAIASITWMALSVALISSSGSFAQSPQGKSAPQSKFADVNGVKLHYLVAGKGSPSCCCMALPKRAICGGR